MTVLTTEKKIFSRLDELTVGIGDVELAKDIEKLTRSLVMESILQLIRYSVYLSSNNLLSDSETDKLVEWMVRSGTQWILDLILDLKSQTTEIFGSEILVSAARLGSTDTVRSLLARDLRSMHFPAIGCAIQHFRRQSGVTIFRLRNYSWMQEQTQRQALEIRVQYYTMPWLCPTVAK